MFYLSNLNNWLHDIKQSCKIRNLDPIASTFMLVIFTSMDFEVSRFFSRYKTQISAYSGKQFHVVTPVIYDDHTIPDDEMRELTRNLRQMGIPVRSEPLIILFKLLKSDNDLGLKPKFFAAFEIDGMKKLNTLIRDVVRLALEKPDIYSLARELEIRFKRRNILPSDLQAPETSIAATIKQQFSDRRVFISHSSDDTDIAFVRRLRKALDEYKVKIWIDELEIHPGDILREKITDGINSCDNFMVILSPESIKSEWVKFEISQFMTKDQKKLIPILFGAKPQDLPAPFKELQNRFYIDFSKNEWDANIKTLIDGLR